MPMTKAEIVSKRASACRLIRGPCLIPSISSGQWAGSMPKMGDRRRKDLGGDPRGKANTNS